MVILLKSPSPPTKVREASAGPSIPRGKDTAKTPTSRRSPAPTPEQGHAGLRRGAHDGEKLGEPIEPRFVLARFLRQLSRLRGVITRMLPQV